MIPFLLNNLQGSRQRAMLQIPIGLMLEILRRFLRIVLLFWLMLKLNVWEAIPLNRKLVELLMRPPYAPSL
jgi:hypothetical protein